jgi:hypothetical protein
MASTSSLCERVIICTIAGVETADVAGVVVAITGAGTGRMAGGGTLVATATVEVEGCDGLGLGALDWEFAGAVVADAGARCAGDVVADTGTMCAGAAVVDAGTMYAGAGCAEDADGVLCFDAAGAAVVDAGTTCA